MFRIIRQILHTRIVSEPLPSKEEAGIEVISSKGSGKGMNQRFQRSVTIRMVDPGSCNGCELEVHAINNPLYNCERFGVHFTASPRFADILLVTGPVSRNMEIALKRTYEATPSPKIVIALGDCARKGGIFGKSYASLGGVDSVIPVDVFIEGCPPDPWKIIQGILKAINQI